MAAEGEIRALVVSLSIDAEEMQRWYRGSASEVLAYSVDGRKVRFPASVLRPFVTRDGVHGHFRILFDNRHKLRGVEKID